MAKPSAALRSQHWSSGATHRYSHRQPMTHPGYIPSLRYGGAVRHKQRKSLPFRPSRSISCPSKCTILAGARECYTSAIVPCITVILLSQTLFFPRGLLPFPVQRLCPTDQVSEDVFSQPTFSLISFSSTQCHRQKPKQRVPVFTEP